VLSLLTEFFLDTTKDANGTDQPLATITMNCGAPQPPHIPQLQTFASDETDDPWDDDLELTAEEISALDESERQYNLQQSAISISTGALAGDRSDRPIFQPSRNVSPTSHLISYK
jgi:hypothetical protein